MNYRGESGLRFIDSFVRIVPSLYVTPKPVFRFLRGGTRDLPETVEMIVKMPGKSSNINDFGPATSCPGPGVLAAGPGLSAGGWAASGLTNSGRAGSSPGRPAGKLPRYALAGLFMIGLGELLLFTGSYWAGVYFTPFQWTGYLLFMDGLHKKISGSSIISDHFGEFLLLLAISIGSWLLFEAYNLLLKNWTYVGLPESRLLRYLGYGWSFATISPGIFLTCQVLNDLLPGGSPPAARPRLDSRLFGGLTGLGLVCLAAPLLWPSTWMAPLVWMGFALFLDPLNHRLGGRSILAEFFGGHRRSLGVFFLSGLACGLLWEFWNYWAVAKWHYDVPYLGHIKLFEMPVLGFLGFLPFTVECFAIYTFIRRLIPIPMQEPYLG